MSLGRQNGLMWRQQQEESRRNPGSHQLIFSFYLIFVIRVLIPVSKKQPRVWYEATPTIFFFVCVCVFFLYLNKNWNSFFLFLRKLSHFFYYYDVYSIYLYIIAEGNAPEGKGHTARIISVTPLQCDLEESLHSPQPFGKVTHPSTRKTALGDQRYK